MSKGAWCLGKAFVQDEAFEEKRRDGRGGVPASRAARPRWEDSDSGDTCSGADGEFDQLVEASSSSGMMSEEFVGPRSAADAPSQEAEKEEAPRAEGGLDSVAALARALADRLQAGAPPADLEEEWLDFLEASAQFDFNAMQEDIGKAQCEVLVALA